MYLFAALQRQLGYPEVPRPRRPDELEARVALLEQKIVQLENRLKFAESDLHTRRRSRPGPGQTRRHRRYSSRLGEEELSCSRQLSCVGGSAARH